MIKLQFSQTHNLKTFVSRSYMVLHLKNSQDKDGGGEVSVKEFDRAMRAAEKLPSKKERQERQTATVGGCLVDEKKKSGFHGKELGINNEKGLQLGKNGNNIGIQ